MCLSKLLEITPEVRKQKYWWRVVKKLPDGSMVSPNYSSRPFKVGVWAKEKLFRIPGFGDYIISYSGSGLFLRYPTGFHCYRYKKDAIKLRNFMETRTNVEMIVQKVEVSKIHAYGEENFCAPCGIFKMIRPLP